MDILRRRLRNAHVYVPSALSWERTKPVKLDVVENASIPERTQRAAYSSPSTDELIQNIPTVAFTSLQGIDERSTPALAPSTPPPPPALPTPSSPPQQVHPISTSYENGPFMIPRDLNEVNRLDFQHYALRQAFGGNFAAPLTAVSSVLDVGTGTGRWGYEMATVFPRANVVGLDILEHAPSPNPPRNYTFVRGNVLEYLPCADASFDYVHQRLLLCRLPSSKLHHVFNELVRVTAIGGWLEVVEAHIDIQHGGPATKKITAWTVEACRQCGIDPYLTIRIGDFLRAVDLMHIEARVTKMPIGHWGGRIGRMMAADVIALCRNMKPRIVEQLSVDPEEYDYVCRIMQKEWELNCCNLLFLIAYGQRLS